jgi:hypothetical protein
MLIWCDSIDYIHNYKKGIDFLNLVCYNGSWLPDFYQANAH